MTADTTYVRLGAPVSISARVTCANRGQRKYRTKSFDRVTAVEFDFVPAEGDRPTQARIWHQEWNRDSRRYDNLVALIVQDDLPAEYAAIVKGRDDVIPAPAIRGPEVAVEPYDLQHGVDWPAQRGRCFVAMAGDLEYRVWVSDCGHVSLGEGLVGGGGREAAPTLAEAEALLAALTAAVAAARQAAAEYAAERARCTCPETSEAERAATYCTETGYEPHGCLCPRWRTPLAEVGGSRP